MMKPLLIYLSLAALAVPAFPIVVEAQTRTRISELQQRSRGTTISGKVVSVVGNDFTLNDGSGEIIVDAGPRWWREIDLEPGEEVTVTGEISKKSGEFDASVINRANGSVIEIRPVEGPPPWASGPNRDRRPAAAPKPPK